MTTDEKLDAIIKEQGNTKTQIEFLSNHFSTKFDDLEKGLFGEEKFKTVGIVGMVHSHDEQIKKMQSIKTWLKGWWAGAMFIFSIISYLIVEGVKYLFAAH